MLQITKGGLLYMIKKKMKKNLDYQKICSTFVASNLNL